MVLDGTWFLRRSHETGRQPSPGLDMQAIAEAVSLGEHLKIDRNIMLDVLSRTAVIPPAFVGKFQKIKNGDYSPEFPLRLMSKDMDLA